MLMPIFILLCLLLEVLIQTHSPYLPLMLDETVWMAGVVVACGFLLAGCLKKVSSSVWHDGFASGVLWAWYGYWEPLFSKGSPIFDGFPIYFAALSGWMFLAFINKSHRFDEASQEALRYLQHYLVRFDTCWLAGLVLIGLALPDHYLSYPLAMTFFIVRSAFQRCMEIIDSQ
jgi:hypothetical protein